MHTAMARGTDSSSNAGVFFVMWSLVLQAAGTAPRNLGQGAKPSVCGRFVLKEE